MDTTIGQSMRAEADLIYRLAACVEDWPAILPHYRRVRVLAGAGGTHRLVEMAARRDVVGPLAIPLRWTAIQTTHPSTRRIEFEHVRGITRGMWVIWTMRPDPMSGETNRLLVQIRHVFKPAWPLPDSLVHQVVGEYFVNGVARLTLRRIAELAEAGPIPSVC